MRSEKPPGGGSCGRMSESVARTSYLDAERVRSSAEAKWVLVGFVFKYRMKKEEEEDGWRPLLPSNEGFETGKKERRVCVEATVQKVRR